MTSFQEPVGICGTLVGIYYHIDPMQKWLPLNYSFIHIQNSLTNLVFETNEVSWAILNVNKRKFQVSHFCIGSIW